MWERLLSSFASLIIAHVLTSKERKGEAQIFASCIVVCPQAPIVMSPMEYLLTLASAYRSRRAYVLAACTGLQPLYHRVTTPTAPPSSAYSAIEICHTAFLYPLPRQMVMTRQYLPTSARYLTGCLVHHQAGLVYQNQNNCNGWSITTWTRIVLLRRRA